jgi:hypothetical protein
VIVFITSSVILSRVTFFFDTMAFRGGFGWLGLCFNYKTFAYRFLLADTFSFGRDEKKEKKKAGAGMF